MKRYGFVIEATSEAALETYKQMHRNVPDEVAGPQGALAKIGVRSMTIMCWPPRTLFMFVEADDRFDPDRDFPRALDLHPAVQAWDDAMHGPDGLLQPVAGNTTALNWLQLQQVFDWDAERPKERRHEEV